MAFALLLLVLLLLPVLLGNHLPARKEIYSAEGWDSTGPHPYIYQQLFEEKGDIDIAFVGSSHLLLGIDTPYVQKQLSEKLGREAVVRTLGWGGGGYDALYSYTQELLKHRRVRMLVIYDETVPEPNSRAPRWLRFGDNAEDIAPLPLPVAAAYYFGMIAGAPRNILSLIRPNMPTDLRQKTLQKVRDFYHAEVPMKRCGSMTMEVGFNSSSLFSDYTPFIPYTPSRAADPSDVLLYSKATRNQFEFQGEPPPEWQRQFAQKMAALARERGSKLVVLNIPVLARLRDDKIHERAFWPDWMGSNVILMGIPPAKLFANMSDEDARKLFSDLAHLNKNGQQYFTQTIIPRLFEVYDLAAKH